MADNKNLNACSQNEIVIYQTDEGDAKIDIRFIYNKNKSLKGV